MFLVPQRQESLYTTGRSLLAAKGGSPDLSPSPEAVSHPFKRKNKGIHGEKPAVLEKAQRKGAKEIHKHLMAKKSFNEFRKSTIQKTLALTAHSMSSEHSASSSEHKNSNGSTRSGSHIFVLVVSTLDQSRSTLDPVDTRSKQVDTRPSFQQISLPDWDSRSTLDQVRSTLDQ
ncbi:hypothetical protein Taro_017162, partial [Colocasia esculenta]|nr:hypothetical protein [Colocasia esculenta]